MGYQKIKNLRKDITILEVFKEVYASEKIHGTSANVSYENDEVIYFPGGVKLVNFMALFDHEKLLEEFRKIGHPEIVVHGEAYGGKCQRMSKVYGPDLKFVAFEVKIGDSWLNVEKAHKVATEMGFEFVHWVRGPATEEFVNGQRDAESMQAIRNGTGGGHIREGVVIRPIIELTRNDGSRMVAKHKHPDFEEVATPREIDPTLAKRWDKAALVADEFVVPMRLDHVLDKFVAEKQQDEVNFVVSMRHTREIQKRMIADIKIEEGDDITWSREVEGAINKKTALLLKEKVL